MHLYAAPAWTFAGKSQEKNTNDMPGPGSYNPSISKFENSPNYKIGTSSRTDFLVSSAPGPGSYETKSSISRSHAPKIGTSKRPPLNDPIQTPGPGTYELRSSLIEGPKYTMTGRKSNSKSDGLPGPGHYNQSFNDTITKEKAPAYRMGSASRVERPSSAYVPGPGNYDSPKGKSGPSWGFGTQSRENIFKIDIPGPGTYEIPTTLDRKAYSMTGRKHDTSIAEVPGPGTYNPGSDRNKSPAWSMGKTGRIDFTNNKKDVPGPGTYSPKNELGKNTPVFGSSTREGFYSTDRSPGPGHYDVKVTKESPSYSIRPRTATTRKKDTPGPGQYNPSVSYYEYKWSIGKEQKGLNYSLSKSASVPGPGYYDVSKGLGGPKWGFGTSTRDKNKKDPNPGPGAYNLFSTISNLPNYALSRSYRS